MGLATAVAGVYRSLSGAVWLVDAWLRVGCRWALRTGLPMKYYTVKIVTRLLSSNFFLYMYVATFLCFADVVTPLGFQKSYLECGFFQTHH